MEQFNLEEYLKNPNRKIVTRDGRSVRIVCTDKKDESGYCIVGLISCDGDIEKNIGFLKEGRLSAKRDSDYDLFFVTESHEGWMVLQKDYYLTLYPGTCIYNTKQDAEQSKCKSDDIIAKIEWEE